MKHFVPTVKTSVKQKIKQVLKRVIQTFYMPSKDKGKKFYNYFLSMPVKDNYIFYEAFAGLGILDNPRAIFKYLLFNPDFADYTHVWSIENTERCAFNLKEFSDSSNVIIVKKDSKNYYRYLATCKYLISNSTFGYYFEKRPEQIYLNTWHGVPTKYMGYEHTVESVENGRGPARNFLAADYVVSYNSFMTEVMYKKAYRLDGLYRGIILECGNPRSDSIFNTTRKEIYKKLSDMGIHTDKKIILYAPTWKGNLYNQLDYDIDDFKNTIKKFSEHIDSSKHSIYLRVHYFLYKILSQDKELSELLIPFTVDTNELLSVTDILISDYSSIFFDFLCTKRPILFYVPDLEDYRSKRGLYIPIEELPGIVSSDINLISKTLEELCKDSGRYIKHYKHLYEKMRDWCVYLDNSNVCEHLAEIVFRNNTSSEQFHNTKYSAMKVSVENHKKKFLICFNTRINSKSHYQELKEFVENIVPEKEDVTVVVTAFKDDFNKHFFNHLAAKARVLIWYELPYYNKYTPEFFQKERTRTLGNTIYDEVKIIGEANKYWAEFANAVVSD